MSSTKFYFNAADEDDEFYGTVAWHKADMRAKGEIERTLYRAKPEPTTHFFWCRHYNEVCGVGDDFFPCGKGCAHYQPRNGKNGRCRHHTNCMEPNNRESIILKLHT